MRAEREMARLRDEREREDCEAAVVGSRLDDVERLEEVVEE